MNILKKEKLIEIFGWMIGIFLFVFIIQNYFKPFVWVVILFFLGSPINKYLKKYFKYKEVCAGITVLIINIAVVIVILYLGNTIFQSIKDLVMFNLNDIKAIFLELEKNIEGLIGEINIIEGIREVLKVDYITLGASSTWDGILSYFVGNVCTFFILSDKELIKENIKKLIPMKIERRINRIIFNFKNIIKIQMMLLFISTMIIIVGFKILAVENCIFLGIICGILDILPYVGTIIVFIPIIIYNIIVKNYLVAFGLVCLYLLIQIVRELLEAKLLSNKFNIHPLLSLLSLYIGMKIFGFIGIFIGPIFCMTIVDIICEKG